MAEVPWTAEEMLTVAAARRLRDTRVCFAGIGLPSAAAILALHVHAPELYLVFESGALGPRPRSLPASVADEELARTAQTIVGVPEIFAYWLAPGRIELGILGAAQVDRFANIDSTVIGDPAAPRLRLPGAGGAPEIAASCRETMIVVRHDPRVFVDTVDFVTTVGHGDGPGARAVLGFAGTGPSAVVTDLGVLEPDPATLELTLVVLHPGATVDGVRAATGWDLRVAAELAVTPAPTDEELTTLRRLRRPT